MINKAIVRKIREFLAAVIFRPRPADRTLKAIFFDMALEIGYECVTITAEKRNNEKHHILK